MFFNQKLKRQIEQYQKTIMEQKSILDSIDHGFCVAKLGPNNEVLGANKTYLDVIGYTLEELKQIGYKKIRDPRISEEEYERLWSAIRDQKDTSGIYSQVSKNGSLVWFYVSFSSFF